MEIELPERYIPYTEKEWEDILGLTYDPLKNKPTMKDPIMNCKTKEELRGFLETESDYEEYQMACKLYNSPDEGTRKWARATLMKYGEGDNMPEYDAGGPKDYQD